MGQLYTKIPGGIITSKCNCELSAVSEPQSPVDGLLPEPAFISHHTGGKVDSKFQVSHHSDIVEARPKNLAL